METMTVNLAGKTRRATWQGREYIVAPLTLIVPGVLSGSKGSLLYPKEEISKEYDAWNAIPIVVYHPLHSGVPVSARRPDVLERQGIGQVFNAIIKDDHLKAEGWFDIEKTRLVDKRVLEALESGRPMELSTGLYTDSEPAPEGAIFNTQSGPRPYKYIARNYRPDHLAILPDRKGACSLADGCGMLVNECLTRVGVWEALAECFGVPLPDEAITTLEDGSKSLVANELSFRDIQHRLDDLVYSKYGDQSSRTGNGPINALNCPFVTDVYRDYLVFEKSGKCYRVGYELDPEDNTITLSQDGPEEVEKVTDYVPIRNEESEEDDFYAVVLNLDEDLVVNEGE